MLKEYKTLTERCVTLTEKTSAILLEFWRKDRSFLIQKKADGTPRSAADMAAHDHLVSELQRITPGIPILSEEGVCPSFSQRCQWREYWLIDPLDGTRGFLEHLPLFSINIALIVDHLPVLGLIAVPPSATVYYAWQGGGAFKQTGQQPPQKIHGTQYPPTEWRIVMGQYSRGKRLTQLINNRFPFQILNVNGSVKFGWLAEGEADVYARLTPISEWDIASGQCILTESGGAMVDLRGQTLQYNLKSTLCTPAFVALADLRWTQQWLEILNQQIDI